MALVKVPRGELDPYEQLEADLNAEMTEIEVVLELMTVQVENRLNNAVTEVARFEASPRLLFFLPK